MVIVYFFFMPVILSCLPLVYSANKPICPKSFSCPNMLPFKYPFYNSTDPSSSSSSSSCGLIKVDCTSYGGKFQFGGRSYPILYKLDSDSSFFIRNYTFKNLVYNKSCEALMNNFTSPSPLLFSFSINSHINIFKCPKILKGNDAYFHKLNYKTYNECKDDNFYYKLPRNDTSVPSDLPHTCKVIQLPVKEQWQDVDNLPRNETDIFSLLSSDLSISFPLSPTCDKCFKNGSHCNTTHNGNVQCLHLQNVLAGSAFILLLCPAIFIIQRWYKRKPFSYFSSNQKSPILEDSSLFFRIPVYSYTELEDATKNFDPSHELGYGGFGSVYYGKLQDGREVAVKRLYEHNYKRIQQFMNEVEILTKLRHPNLVLLYGCTSKQSRDLLLVYEFIPNGTVADHLHGDLANRALLTWQIRMNIAIETASALVYLHASEIIHRDVKTNNILLDHNFSVKVADFGLSRLVPSNVTHVSTAPQGTPGYVDPQYHQRYQLTDKSDVYSFGVVLIELISSMVAVDLNRSQDEITLANLALNRIQRCAIEELIDPVLGADSDDEIMRMITLVAELAFRCLQYDSEMRPSMNEVLDVLMDIQSDGRRTEGCDSIEDLETLNPQSETSDVVVLLKDFLPSPVSVTSEWKSENSASTAMEMDCR